MPVLTMERTAAPVQSESSRSVLKSVAARVKLPAWSILVLVVLAIASGFAAGRRHPAHHYVPYFGSMVMDTTTGKACYAVAPKPANTVQDADFAVDGTANPVDRQAANGPAIPVCGQE